MLITVRVWSVCVCLGGGLACNDTEFALKGSVGKHAPEACQAPVTTSAERKLDFFFLVYSFLKKRLSDCDVVNPSNTPVSLSRLLSRS